MAALEIIALDTATPQLRAPGTGDTYSAPRALALTPETLTGSAATSGLSLTQTWNTSGTPTALKLDVTDTASNAASLLMDLQVGGTTKFRVNKFGAIILNDNSSYVGDAGGTRARLATGSSPYLGLASGAFIGFSASNVQVHDLILTRDAANTLALRNSTNAQAFNLYNTFTDASNYERLEAVFSSNIAYLRTAKAGTGSDRVLVLNAGGGVNQTIAIGVNEVTFGKPLVMSQQYTEMREQTAPAAPAADRVRIYAEDDGAGKTRLMALFATGAAQQIAIEP